MARKVRVHTSFGFAGTESYEDIEVEEDEDLDALQLAYWHDAANQVDVSIEELEEEEE